MLITNSIIVWKVFVIADEKLHHCMKEKASVAYRHEKLVHVWNLMNIIASNSVEFKGDSKFQFYM